MKCFILTFYNIMKGMINLSNSSLVSYTNITKNKTSPRNHKIDTITIHCYCAQVNAKQGCDYFATTDRKCSSNYVVGKDGSIGLSVEEKDRSWCSSNSANDNRAITIEVASDTKAPYKITDEAYNALIILVTDICKRNNIKKLVWSTNKTDRVNHRNGCNMTVHRDYANKACPGAYLYERHQDIANQVNKLLNTNKKPILDTSKNNSKNSFLVKVSISNLRIRSGAGTGYASKGYIKPGTYTIVETKTANGYVWGKLKSGAGWIALNFTKRV